VQSPELKLQYCQRKKKNKTKKRHLIFQSSSLSLNSQSDVCGLEADALLLWSSRTGPELAGQEFTGNQEFTCEKYKGER
jgi:hypothetical protein